MAALPILFACRTVYLHVWMMWHAGWLLTKSEVLWCSSTRHQHQIPDRTVRIRSAAVQPVSTVRELGISWMARSPWVLMSLLSSKQVSRHCDGSVASGVRHHVVPYWPWFERWSVRLTTVIQC